ncbi:MAG: hypothetical protein KAX38_04870 [Candidatus Krumholzibacteria bacterium]|nr:hypothetical protein [Candidatus Krumholzibacteria bacterium]
MNRKVILSGIGLVFLLCITITGTVYGQATAKQNVIHLGAAYTQALVDNAQAGFVGLNMFFGKMLTNNICLGISTGYDIVSFRSVGDMKERVAVAPLQIKAKCYMNLGPMLQLYASAAGGAYRVIPHLGTEKIGTLGGYTTTQPGGSVGIGLDYWFLLTTGVGFELEYHTFTTDGDDMFSYFAARVDYCLIKF